MTRLRKFLVWQKIKSDQQEIKTPKEATQRNQEWHFRGGKADKRQYKSSLSFNRSERISFIMNTMLT